MYSAPDAALEGRQVLSAASVTRHTFALGLSRGDVQCVYVGPLARGQSGSLRRGPVLKDATMLQSLLSNYLFANAEKNLDTLALGPVEGSNGAALFLAVNAGGFVRVWNGSAEQSVSVTCLSDLVQSSLAAAADPSLAQSRGFNSTERDPLKLQCELMCTL